MSKCKHCNRCKNGCDFCACCGKCQRCGAVKPLDFAPMVPQFIPMPYPVPAPNPQPWIDLWRQPIITWDVTGSCTYPALMAMGPATFQ